MRHHCINPLKTFLIALLAVGFGFSGPAAASSCAALPELMLDHSTVLFAERGAAAAEHRIEVDRGGILIVEARGEGADSGLAWIDLASKVCSSGELRPIERRVGRWIVDVPAAGTVLLRTGWTTPAELPEAIEITSRFVATDWTKANALHLLDGDDDGEGTGEANEEIFPRPSGGAPVKLGLLDGDDDGEGTGEANEEIFPRPSSSAPVKLGLLDGDDDGEGTGEANEEIFPRAAGGQPVSTPCGADGSFHCVTADATAEWAMEFSVASTVDFVITASADTTVYLYDDAGSTVSSWQVLAGTTVNGTLQLPSGSYLLRAEIASTLSSPYTIAARASALP